MRTLISIGWMWGMRIGIAILAWQSFQTERTVSHATTLLAWPPGRPNPNNQWTIHRYGYPVPWLDVHTEFNIAARRFAWRIHAMNPAVLWLALVFAYQAPLILGAGLGWAAGKFRPRQLPADEILIPSQTRYRTRFIEGLSVGMLLGGVMFVGGFLIAARNLWGGSFPWVLYTGGTCGAIVIGAIVGACFGLAIREPHARDRLVFSTHDGTGAPAKSRDG